MVVVVDVDVGMDGLDEKTVERRSSNRGVCKSLCIGEIENSHANTYQEKKSPELVMDCSSNVFEYYHGQGQLYTVYSE